MACFGWEGRGGEGWFTVAPAFTFVNLENPIINDIRTTMEVKHCCSCSCCCSCDYQTAIIPPPKIFIDSKTSSTLSKGYYVMRNNDHIKSS